MAWKLYYDGECNLCHGSQLQVVKWAVRAKQPLETEILQSEEARQKGYVGDAMILEADRVYKAHKAWLKLMRFAPWNLCWVGWIGSVPVFSHILGFGYAIEAKYRKKWFGVRACPIHPKP